MELSTHSLENMSCVASMVPPYCKTHNAVSDPCPCVVLMVPVPLLVHSTAAGPDPARTAECWCYDQLPPQAFFNWLPVTRVTVPSRHTSWGTGRPSSPTGELSVSCWHRSP